MYTSPLYYNKEGLGKFTVCIYDQFIITRKDAKKLRYSIYHQCIITNKDEEKLQYVYTTTLL